MKDLYSVYIRKEIGTKGKFNQFLSSTKKKVVKAATKLLVSVQWCIDTYRGLLPIKGKQLQPDQNRPRINLSDPSPPNILPRDLLVVQPC